MIDDRLRGQQHRQRTGDVALHQQPIVGVAQQRTRSARASTRVATRASAPTAPTSLRAGGAALRFIDALLLAPQLRFEFRAVADHALQLIGLTLLRGAQRLEVIDRCGALSVAGSTDSRETQRRQRQQSANAARPRPPRRATAARCSCRRRAELRANPTRHCSSCFLISFLVAFSQARRSRRRPRARRGHRRQRRAETRSSRQFACHACDGAISALPRRHQRRAKPGQTRARHRRSIRRRRRSRRRASPPTQCRPVPVRVHTARTARRLHPVATARPASNGRPPRPAQINTRRPTTSLSGGSASIPSDDSVSGGALRFRVRRAHSRWFDLPRSTSAPDVAPARIDHRHSAKRAA